jgi:predicted membrane protein
MENKNVDQRIWFGIGAILLGLVFLANNFGIFDYEIRRYLFRWEVILMALGVFFIVARGNRSTGIILLVIGAVFYLSDFLHYDFSFWQIFWPALLILAGVMIIFRHRLDRDGIGRNQLTDDNVVDELAIFGGGDRIVSSQHFQGGRVTCIFGGLNYNLLKAKLAPGENYIDVFCMFGGMNLVIPENWNVKIRVTSIFGGFNDKSASGHPSHLLKTNRNSSLRGLRSLGEAKLRAISISPVSCRIPFWIRGNR